MKSLKSSTIDLARFPPSKAYLKEHVAWPNYQTRTLKTAIVPISEVPKLREGHPWLAQNGKRLWCDPAMVRPEL